MGKRAFDVFRNQPIVIPDRLDPEYEAHIEQSLFAIPSMHASDADVPTPTIHDEILGDLTFNDAYADEYTIQLQQPAELLVQFATVPAERVRALLPHVHRILGDFERIRRAGIDFLWESGGATTWNPSPPPWRAESESRSGASGRTRHLIFPHLYVATTTERGTVLL